MSRYDQRQSFGKVEVKRGAGIGNRDAFILPLVNELSPLRQCLAVSSVSAEIEFNDQRNPASSRFESVFARCAVAFAPTSF